MTAPDFIEPIVGYRAWRIDGGVLVPWSMGVAGAWEPGANTARCVFHAEHRAPVAQCSCGLYALADASDERLRPDHEAVGAIVAWGDVEVHRTGFRAELAAIVALALPDRVRPAHEQDLRLAAARYGVPLVPADRLVEAACEHGRPIPFETIPRHRPARADVPPLDRVGLTGIAVDDHVEVTLVATGVRLAATPAVRAVSEPGGTALVEVGTRVRRGDLLTRLNPQPPSERGQTPLGGLGLESAGNAGEPTGRPNPRPPSERGQTPLGGLVVRAVVSGEVVEVGDGLVVIAPSRWEEEAVEVAWGAAGVRAYGAALADLGRRGDPFADIRTAWVTATAGIRSAADVRRVLRAAKDAPRFPDEHAVYATVGAALRSRLASEEGRRAARRLGGTVLWRLHRPDAAMLLDLDSGAVRFDAPDAQADLVLYAAAETADDLVSGRTDFAKALRARDVQSSAATSEVLRAASVLQRLHG